MSENNCAFFQCSMISVYRMRLHFKKLLVECRHPIEVLLPGQDISEEMRAEFDVLNKMLEQLAEHAKHAGTVD